jgi:hypothetical protein
LTKLFQNPMVFDHGRAPCPSPRLRSLARWTRSRSISQKWAGGSESLDQGLNGCNWHHPLHMVHQEGRTGT